MTSVVYPPATREIGERRRKLAPEIHQAFDAFSQQVFADGALPEKTKQLIAVAVAHVTQCPYCIRGHTKLAHRAGARDEEIMEAIWVAADMRAGGAFAHSTVALHARSPESTNGDPSVPGHPLRPPLSCGPGGPARVWWRVHRMTWRRGAAPRR
jgi:AhpD family alkylhydroperoxidase